MTVFTNYDLSEQGKDWEDCLSAVHFMTEKLYAETEIPKVSFLLSYYRKCIIENAVILGKISEFIA